MKLSRRKFIACAAILPVTTTIPVFGQSGVAIHLYKGKGCGCCSAWEDILKSEGFGITADTLHPAELVTLKAAKGVPQQLFSCHTAVIEDYIIEGHVPPADIRRLMSEKPDALGLAVPEMPYGSPGMGPETEREAYNVFLFRRDGTSEVFTRYAAAS